MQNDTFEMSTGQAHEFAMACARNGLTRADVKFLAMGNNLRRSMDFLHGTSLVPGKSKLLESVTTLAFPGTKRFAAADRFKVDISKKAKVKIAFLWDNFRNNFVEKIEENVPAGDVRVHKLVKSSVDKPIIAELGDAHETHLADLWAMLERQPNGEKGDLLVNGYANIFYVKDKNGNLWAVDAGWHAGRGGWDVGADPVSDSGRWRGGSRVVSR